MGGTGGSIQVAPAQQYLRKTGRRPVFLSTVARLHRLPLPPGLGGWVGGWLVGWEGGFGFGGGWVGGWVGVGVGWGGWDGGWATPLDLSMVAVELV